MITLSGGCAIGGCGGIDPSIIIFIVLGIIILAIISYFVYKIIKRKKK